MRKKSKWNFVTNKDQSSVLFLTYSSDDGNQQGKKLDTILKEVGVVESKERTA